MFKPISFGWLIVALILGPAACAHAEEYLSAAQSLLISIEDYQASNRDAANSSPTALAFEDLQAELARPRYMSPNSLREIASLLRNNLASKDDAGRRIVESVEALAQRLDLKPEDWPEYCRKLADRTARQPPVDYDAEKRRLSRQIERFDRQLSVFPAESRAKWENYLLWSKVKEISTSPAPAAARLDYLEIRWTNALLSWDYPPLTATALGVEDFIRSARRAQDNRSPQEWAAILRRFAEILEKSNDTGTAGDTLMALAADLERNGVAGELIVAVRRKFAYPNALVIFSAKNIERRFEKKIDEPFDVNDYFAGAISRGSGRMTGMLSWKVHPSPSIARWQWRLKTVSRSRSTGYRDGVQVGSQGTTEIDAVKSFSLNGAGIADRPASTDASSTVNFESIAAGGRSRRQSAATGEVYASRPQAERDASEHAKRSIDARLDKEGENLVKKANAAYDRAFKQAAAISTECVNTVITRSLESEFQWLCFSERPGSFAATRPAPRNPPIADARMELHRSFVEGLLAGRLCNENSTAGDFFTAPTASKENEADSAEDEWQIQWESEKPISCSFAEGKMRLELHIKKFITADGVYPGVVVATEYRPELHGDVMTLARDGALNVTLQGQKGEKISGRQLILRQTLRRRIERVLGVSIPLGEEEIGKIVGQSIAMKIVDLKCAEDWLMIDLELKNPENP